MDSTPKGNNALMSPSQSKPALDSQQNSANSTPSQTKGKKRERGDHCSDPVKRERSSKTDDGDSGSAKIESISRSEAAKLIIEKGCLVGSESVEKLVEFIQLNRMDKKLDLVSRSMVAGVIAATDRFDCLSHFVQIKGLTVLDEWLQDVHNSRIGELSVSKDCEKPVEEFLLVLLRALDKLPVNLHALQTCNIGRSVNRLRSHRNPDIQRKARILVDIWKKRVEAEMNVLDAKSGSNHGSRNSIGSYDVSLKSSVTQDSGSNSKTVLNKASMEETTTKSICSSSGTVKAPPEKEAQPRTGPYSGSDVPLSGQESNNSSHSFPGQEETRITTGVLNASKNSSGSSRHQRSSNGFFVTSESPKEILGRNNSINRNASVEKLLPSSPSCEKTFEVPVVETSSHKLIVKILNRIEPEHGSPAKCTSGASFDDHSVISSRASSPVLSNIQIEYNDHKDLQIESNDQGKFSAALDEASEKSKVPRSSLENDLKDKQFLESSTSALNTLIESCAKYSELNAPTSSSGDDVGMNLLASVATREMSAPGGVSPTDSMLGGTIQDEKKCSGDDSKSKASSGDNHVSDRSPIASESEKQMKVSADCTEMNERRYEITQSKGVLLNMMEAKCSEDNGTRDTSLLDDVSEVKKNQDEIASLSLSIETHPKKDLDANSNSGEPVGPCISDKDGTNEEHMFSEANGKCANNGGLCKSEGQRRQKKEATTAADEDRDIDGRGKLKRPKLCATEGGKMEETTTSTISDGVPLSSSGVSRIDFDLNEGFSGHDSKCGELDDVRLLPNPVSFGCANISSASITVTSAAKGPFVPPFDLLRNKGELGWKGSATTSAFRPVEPRKATQMIASHSNVSMSEEDNRNKPCRVQFDFDLNVADERLLEDMDCQDSSTNFVNNQDHLRNKVNGPLIINHSGGFDLDLNRVDDTNVVPVKSLLSGSISTTTEVKRDFDLNSGPGFDDIVIGDQSSLLPQLSMNSLSPAFGVRQPNSLESKNFSSWLPSGNQYSSVVIHPTNRGEHPFSVVSPMAAPQRIVGPSSGGGGGPFIPDMYRGSLLSPSGPYPYQMFPFGTTLPLPSATFSVGPASTSNGRIFNPMVMNSQFLAPGSEISSQYQKKYMLGLHEGSDNRQRFDLNAGPGVPEVENRDDFLAQRQLYVSGSQSVTDSVLRRKEPEAGLDRESLRYKQSSWH